jgi:hypothetical protein
MYIHKIVQLRVQVVKYNFVCLLINRQKLLYSLCDFNMLLHFILFFRVCCYTQYSRIMYCLLDFFFFYYSSVMLLYNTYASFLFCYSFSIYFFTFSTFYKKGIVSLPTHVQKYTVLRSPHTDKKSREQFERRTHRKVYVFPAILYDYYLFLCNAQYVYFSCTLVLEQTESYIE